MEDKETKPITRTAGGFSVEMRWRTYLWHGADFVHLADELAVGLIEQEQLEVQLVQPLAELQLLEREGAWERTAIRARSVKLARSDTHTGSLGTRGPLTLCLHSEQNKPRSTPSARLSWLIQNIVSLQWSMTGWNRLERGWRESQFRCICQ